MNDKLSVLAMILFTAVSIAEAQQQAKIPKIGWLAARPASDTGGGYELIRRELRALGYVDGKNIAFEYRTAEGKIDRLPALADELVRLKVDVLIAAATSEALAAKNATRTIPIVFFGAGDPVAAGLVDSLARPGGNLTGFTAIAPQLAGKRLELLKETISQAFPRCSAVGSTGSRLCARMERKPTPGTRNGSAASFYGSKQRRWFRGRTQKRNESGERRSWSDVEPVVRFQSKSNRGPCGKKPTPAIYIRGEYVVESGGLMSYRPDRNEPFRRGALFVDKILKGTKPADIPVEQPIKFEFIINLKAAKQIGLTIPPNVLVRADRVIR